MKTIIAAFLMVLTVSSIQAQDQLIIKDGKYIFEKTLKEKGSGEQLYERALQWIAAQQFGKPEKGVAFPDVISYRSKDEGKIFGNGKFKFDTKYPKLGYYDYMYMTFKFRIYVEDNKCRYVFSDFRVNRLTWHKRDHIGNTSFEDYSQTGYYRRHSETSIRNHLSKLISDMELAMKGEL